MNRELSGLQSHHARPGRPCHIVTALVTLLVGSTAFGQSEARDAFVQSLSLRPDRIIVDQSVPTTLWLTQTTAAPYAPTGALKLNVSIFKAPPPQPAPGGNAPPPAAIPADTKPEKSASFDAFVRDFVQRPFGVSLDLAGLPDGNYRVVMEVMEGDASLKKMEESIWLANGIVTRLPDVKKRLEKIQGHEGTKASVLYPYDFARNINLGRRSYDGGRDIGIDEQSLPNYLNFAEELKRSDELLAALESGKDPLWQAKGDLKKHYYFTDADEVMPYRVYVPSTWDGKTALPLVFILHGNTRNQDFYFDRDSRIIPNHAEKHGYLIVATFGYHPNGGYNYSSMRGGGGGRGAGRAGGGGRGGRGGRGRGGGFMNGMPSSQLGELSEKDTLNVYDLIHKEYPIDPKRTFLFGYSAGGQGSYYMAQKYPEKWVAVALGGSNMGPNNYPIDRVKHLPFLIAFGDQDNPVIQPSRATAAAMKEAGMTVELYEMPGHDHNTSVAGMTPRVFEFFNAHPKK